MKLSVLAVVACMLAGCAQDSKPEQSARCFSIEEHVAQYQPVCVEYQRQLVATYPNSGLMALGSQYIALAMVPVFVEQDVCAKWERPAPKEQ